MIDTPMAFPLSWPAGRRRTPVADRRSAPFGQKQAPTAERWWRTKTPLTVAQATSRLVDELRRLGAEAFILSTNLRLRVDGLPRSDQRKPEDPGVAVYFDLAITHAGGATRPIVLACDSYSEVAGNIGAIAKYIEAMRAMERYGVGSLEQMFTGFTALPPAMAPNDWREPLGNPRTLAEAEANYRERMKYAHPDVEGGNEVVAAKLNAAIEKAREVLK